jgi:hypothetical protein
VRPTVGVDVETAVPNVQVLPFESVTVFVADAEPDDKPTTTRSPTAADLPAASVTTAVSAEEVCAMEPSDVTVIATSYSDGTPGSAAAGLENCQPQPLPLIPP